MQYWCYLNLDYADGINIILLSTRIFEGRFLRNVILVLIRPRSGKSPWERGWFTHILLAVLVFSIAVNRIYNKIINNWSSARLFVT